MIDRAIELQVEREIPPSPDGNGTWWARRILRYVELGQAMPFMSVQMAREALGMAQPPKQGGEGLAAILARLPRREPGEEG